MSGPDDALQRAIADACLGADAGKEIASDLAGFLERRGVSPEDMAAALRAPRRLAVYRSLVRNGLSSVVLHMLPRTRGRLNAAAAGRFDADFAAFVDERGPRTHFLRDVPFEFVAWASPRWRADETLPAYVADLASHELTHFDVASADAIAPDAELGDVALDRALVFHASTRLVRYAFAVHELSPEPHASDAPPARDVRLLAYRDADHGVRWLELTPLAAAIAHRLLGGEALAPAIEHACADLDALPSAVSAEVARLLADLGARGVLLGARAD